MKGCGVCALRQCERPVGSSSCGGQRRGNGLPRSCKRNRSKGHWALGDDLRGAGFRHFAHRRRTGSGPRPRRLSAPRCGALVEPAGRACRAGHYGRGGLRDTPGRRRRCNDRHNSGPDRHGRAHRPPGLAGHTAHPVQPAQAIGRCVARSRGLDTAELRRLPRVALMPCTSPCAYPRHHPSPHLVGPGKAGG